MTIEEAGLTNKLQQEALASAPLEIETISKIRNRPAAASLPAT
jgi:hypothetical protein